MYKRIALLLLIGLLNGTAIAGIVFEIDSTRHGAAAAIPQAETVRASVEGRNLKMEVDSSSGQSDGDMIFHGERREMIVVDHDDKSYMVIDEAMLRSIGEQLGGIEAQIQEALKDVPADQRAMVEQMMKQRMPKQAQAPRMPSFELRKTSTRDKKNGYPCRKYELWINGKLSQEMWVTDWDNIEGGDEAADAFHDMAAFFQEMRDSFPDFGQQDDSSDNMFEHMKEMDGFPVLTLEYADDGSLLAESQLRSSKRRTLDPADFDPPSGYKRQQMPGR